MKAKKIIPELIVKDIPEMIVFYEKFLGFELDATDPEELPYTWVQLVNGDCSIMMQDLESTKNEISTLTNQISGTDLLMVKLASVADVKELYEQVIAGNVEVYMPIKTTEYGSCEFGIKDPEGRHIIVSG